MELINSKEYYVDSLVVHRLINEVNLLRAKLVEYEQKLYECRCKIEYLEDRLNVSLSE